MASSLTSQIQKSMVDSEFLKTAFRTGNAKQIYDETMRLLNIPCIANQKKISICKRSIKALLSQNNGTASQNCLYFH